MLKSMAALAALMLVSTPAVARQAPKTLGDPSEAQFRSLYKELVETNTTLSAGSCTLAAERMAARLKAAGFPDSDLHPFVDPAHPREGGLVVAFPGRDPAAKAILLLAHIDVVEARREDWTRDPFTLIEDGGYFYARGSSDDKAQAAIWIDTLIRYRQEGYKPRRTLKLALTCGEETVGAFNGAEWLTKNRRDLIDAQFALNEGAGGELDAAGKPVVHSVLAAEKTFQNYRLEVTNPGGHSSRPRPDNAIYSLAAALGRISAYEFPVQLNDANRGYFSRMSKIVGGGAGAAMAAIVANPQDKAADALLSKDANYHAMLRTTCVATILEAGHATNALPQRARANVNCRIFPGVPAEAVRQTLTDIVADPAVSVTIPETRGPTPPPTTFPPSVLTPIERISQQMWPGVPVVPLLQPGGTDGVFLNAAGIPTYGVSGIFSDPDLGGIHGLNERIRVRSLLDGRTFLYRLVKAYADAP